MALAIKVISTYQYGFSMEVACHFASETIIWYDCTAWQSTSVEDISVRSAAYDIQVKL